jgi:hypothetical protein
MQSHFRHLHLKIFLMVYGTFQSNELRPLELFFEDLEIHRDFQFPKWEPTWECVGSFPHILLHSHDHEMWFSGFIFDPHLCKPLLWSQAQG